MPHVAPLASSLVLLPSPWLAALFARRFGVAPRHALLVFGAASAAAIGLAPAAGALWAEGAEGARGAATAASDGLAGSSLTVVCIAATFGVFAWRLFDGASLARWVALGTAIAAALYGARKLVCFARGCCYGTWTFGWWAHRFAPDSLAGRELPNDHFVHPVQLYEAALAFAVGAALVLVARRLPARWLAPAGVTALAALRLLVHPLRADYAAMPRPAWALGATLDDAVCLLALAGAALAFSLPGVVERLRARPAPR